MVRLLGPLVAVVLFPLVGLGQSQAYLDNNRQRVNTNDPKLWTDKGDYSECLWEAYDATGKRINSQKVICYHGGPKDGDDSRSNYWVYWYKLPAVGTKPGTIWGRCPTPKHPDYERKVRAEGDKDLWQIIPEGRRKPGVLMVADLKGSFGPTISTKATGLPKIAMAEEGQPPITQPIDCIDFTNPFFN